MSLKRNLFSFFQSIANNQIKAFFALFLAIGIINEQNVSNKHENNSLYTIVNTQTEAHFKRPTHPFSVNNCP